MRSLSQPAALLAALALAWPLAGGADPAPASGQAGSAAATRPEAAKPGQPAEAKPACRVCGGTCGLEPICVWEPGTKKKPTTTYSMRCEPVCVPSPRPWHGGEGRHPLSCTGGPCDGSCGGATVRTKKSLLKTITEEEVDVVTRKIEHVCRHCSGRETASSCTSCTDPGPTRSWWPWAWLLAR